jgi:hypothetical protein
VSDETDAERLRRLAEEPERMRQLIAFRLRRLTDADRRMYVGLIEDFHVLPVTDPEP